MASGRQRGTREIAWSAWTAHAYTASGALLAFLATLAIFAGRFRAAFLWLFTAVVIDATDGWLARRVRVGDRLPQDWRSPTSTRLSNVRSPSGKRRSTR